MATSEAGCSFVLKVSVYLVPKGVSPAGGHPTGSKTNSSTPGWGGRLPPRRLKLVLFGSEVALTNWVVCAPSESPSREQAITPAKIVFNCFMWMEVDRRRFFVTGETINLSIVNRVSIILSDYPAHCHAPLVNRYSYFVQLTIRRCGAICFSRESWETPVTRPPRQSRYLIRESRTLKYVNYLYLNTKRRQ